MSGLCRGSGNGEEENLLRLKAFMWRDIEGYGGGGEKGREGEGGEWRGGEGNM